MKEPMRAMLASPLFGYIFAVAIAAVAVGVRWLVDPLFGDSFRLLAMHPAIAVAVWIGGYRPAILTALLGYAASNYLFWGTSGSFSLSASTLIGFGGFSLSTAVIIILGEAIIRARRKAEERNQVLQSTLEGIVDAVIATDTEERITRLNPAANSLTAWSSENAVGQSITTVFQLVDHETRKPIPSAVAEALRTGRVMDIGQNALLVASDGCEYFVGGRAVPISDRRGHITGCVLAFRDNTEQRRKEELLRRSEHELADFFENAAIGIHWVDADGKILKANQAELELLGYSRDEYVGRCISEIHADEATIEDILTRLKCGEELHDYPARLRCKDGSIEYVLISSNGLFEEGKFIHSRCFTRSVTDRKQVEETRAQLAAIVSASDDAIVSKSLHGIIRSWNAGAERLLGYTEAEIVGRPINTIIPPELQNEELEIISRIRRGERTDHFETVRLTKDGRRIDVSLTVSPIFDDTGKVTGASKVARDITERKHAEQALRASEQRFRLMADSAPVLIWVADTDGNRTWFNKQWLEFTGRRMEQETGGGWTENLHPDDIGGVLQTYKASFNKRHPFTVEYRLRDNEGQYRWMLVTGLPLHSTSGEFTGYIGSCIDISDRKEAEQALQEADQRKDEFLATLAHELRNPLAPIGNSIEILKQAELNVDLIRQSRDTIERQLNHLVRLVDDLLNISRITRDKLTLNKTPVELASVVQQALETVQPVAEELGHELVIELPKHTICLNADSVRLAQVISNLVNNACKFTNPGGRIALTAEYQDQDEYVSITVKDSGIGIAADQLDFIFDMFSQAHTALARSFGGLGIGLTLAKRLVEMHDGCISAHSKGVGYGSEFVVKLPVLKQGLATQHSPAQMNGKAARTRRILIVDDNLDSAETLAILLRLNGHQAHLAHDGLEAINAAEQLRPELILLDIGLPKLDGFDACRRIRKEPWGKNITIAAVTGWGQDNDRRKSQAAGFDAHFVKPVDYAALSRLLDSAAVESVTMDNGGG